MDIKEVCDMLPPQLTKYVKQININKYINYQEEGFVGGEVFPKDSKIVNLYNTPFYKEDYIPILIHELGHVLDLNFNKKFYHTNEYIGISNSHEWINAIYDDDNGELKLVTDYAFDSYEKYLIEKEHDKLYIEDFADSIRLYFWSDRGGFKRNYPNRSKVIERLLYG